jgi:hypothetical protein
MYMTGADVLVIRRLNLALAEFYMGWRELEKLVFCHSSISVTESGVLGIFIFWETHCACSKVVSLAWHG